MICKAKLPFKIPFNVTVGYLVALFSPLVHKLLKHSLCMYLLALAFQANGK
jgi:hypothetical protein